MKTYIVSLFLLFMTISFAQKNESHFKSEIDFGNGTIFSTFLDVTIKKSHFTITSPKNADVRMFGGKARLGRLLGKSPKKGIIITIKVEQKNDSLFGETKIPMYGKLKFKGILKDETLSGDLFSNDTTSIGTIQGINSKEDRINYSYLYPLIINTIQNNIYSKDVLKTKDWEKFQKNIYNLCNTAHDDIELFLGFNILNKKLPFTHLNLIITQDSPDIEKTVSIKKSVFFEEKNTTTAYVLIKNFSSSKAELATILPKIIANDNYKNLIIDLRDNPGGGIEAAFELAKYIANKDMEIGYFVTNKLQYSGYQPELFKTLPKLQPKNTKEFTIDLKTSSGGKLIFKKPDNPVFKGDIYVLTNGMTGSTCEPIVYALKNTKRAIIIGEKTYGGMLAAVGFDVYGKYSLLVPISDFFTYDGVRLDKVGVTPDIEVKSEDALEKALELIHTNQN
jgi:hypothetical protein